MGYRFYPGLSDIDLGRCADLSLENYSFTGGKTHQDLLNRAWTLYPDTEF